MSRLGSRLLVGSATAAALLALSVAGCGGSSSTPAPPKTASGHTATVGLDGTNLGKVLVDSQGRTLYLFAADTGPKSTCTGACASGWPPLDASSKPTSGAGLKAALIGTTKRPGGQTQVTYDGHPLYRYSGDQQPGDTTGQRLNAFGAQWFAVTASGGRSTGSASSGGSTPGY
jgi:predicted lipoprotein with Yx(FWY)xxD motif